jgi:hypothetical protein
VLLSSRRPYGRKIMNLFRKLKSEFHLFQQYFTPLIPLLKQDESKTNLGPDTSQAHPSYTQQFLSVNVSNLAGQCQTDIVTRYGPQAPTRFNARLKSNSNTNTLNQNVGKQRKNNYEKNRNILFFTI